MESYKVLRKVGMNEIMQNLIPMSPNIFLTTRIRSRVNLFAHLDELKSAIHLWKSMNSFLSAKVVSQGDEYLYVVDENSSANKNLGNVHFLRGNSSIIDADLRKILIEDNLLVELALDVCASEIIKIDKNPELLWKLLVIEMTQEENDEQVYEFIWQINHMIADGISSSNNLILLIDVIHQMTVTKKSSKQQVESSDFGLYEGTLKMFENEIMMAPKSLPKDYPTILRPEFLNPEKARQNSKSLYSRFFERQSNDFELFDLNSNKCFVTLPEMIRISKESSTLRRKNLEISEEKTLELLKKSKQNNTRLTSVLNTILSIATFRLFQAHGLKLSVLVNRLPVSLRQFRSPSEIGKFQLGNCTGGLVLIIDNTFENPADDSEVRAKFWSIAREQSASLQDRVKNDYSKYAILELPIPFDDNKRLLIHTNLSNIGIIDTSGYECFRETFKIENLYTACNYEEILTTLLSSIYINTIDNKICCSLANNSYFFDPSLADELIENLKKILNIVLELN